VLQPGREVGRIADRRVVHAEVVADLADDHRPGVEPHSDTQLHLVRQPKLRPTHLQRQLDSDRGKHGPARVILMGHGGAEECHEAVAEELIDRPLVAMDLGKGQLEELVKEGMHALGAEAFGEGCGACDVAEEHGNLLTRTLVGTPRDEDLLGEVLGGVGLRSREISRDRRFRREPLPAHLAEAVVRSVRRIALGARNAQLRSALRAESGVGRGFVLAPGTLHAWPPESLTDEVRNGRVKISRLGGCGQ
jgi:hypothetical protein